MRDVDESSFRSGFVALLGRPNAGKSTLTNAILGQKVAITSPKPQTTRTRVRGILNRETSQIVFVDTPGFCGNDNALKKAMRRTARTTPADCDLTLLVVEVYPSEEKIELTPEDEQMLLAAREAHLGVVVVLNKVDRLKPKQLLLPWMEFYGALEGVLGVVPVSALRSDGLDALEGEIFRHLEVGPPLFPREFHTDQTERQLCEELIREQLLWQTQQEVPHGVAVIIEQFEDQREADGGLVRVEGRIFVDRESQKGIVVGKQGARIKAISEKARIAMEEVLQAKVYLRMQVAVDKQWTRRPDAISRYGIGEASE